MQCEKNDRLACSHDAPRRSKVVGERGLLKQSDSENDSKATCPQTFQLSVKIRPGSARSGSGNHQPISLSAPTRLVIVPCVHCAPIVIGYQRYFCLNCRMAADGLRREPTVSFDVEDSRAELVTRKEFICPGLILLILKHTKMWMSS